MPAKGQLVAEIRKFEGFSVRIEAARKPEESKTLERANSFRETISCPNRR
jgi:hypothetical protein